MILLTGAIAVQAQHVEIPWEYLEISSPSYSIRENETLHYRHYNFLTAGESFSGPTSLAWLKGTGWELTSTVSFPESGQTVMYFKRQVDDARTSREISLLKNKYDSQPIVRAPSKQNRKVVDLDRTEQGQKLVEYNRTEEAKLRAALGMVQGVPMKILSVRSGASNVGSSRVAADVVIDASSILVKNGNQYRSSEADTYLRDTALKIAQTARISYRDDIQPNAALISEGLRTPEEPGKEITPGGSVSIRLTLVIVVMGEQNIIAQGYINGNWLK